MIQIPQPLTLAGPTSRQIGHKLAKLIATIRNRPKPLPPVHPSPYFRNGMDALAKWEQEHDAASDNF